MTKCVHREVQLLHMERNDLLFQTNYYERYISIQRPSHLLFFFLIKRSYVIPAVESEKTEKLICAHISLEIAMISVQFVRPKFRVVFNLHKEVLRDHIQSGYGVQRLWKSESHFCNKLPKKIDLKGGLAQFQSFQFMVTWPLLFWVWGITAYDVGEH